MVLLLPLFKQHCWIFLPIYCAAMHEWHNFIGKIHSIITKNFFWNNEWPNSPLQSLESVSDGTVSISQSMLNLIITTQLYHGPYELWLGCAHMIWPSCLYLVYISTVSQLYTENPTGKNWWLNQSTTQPNSLQCMAISSLANKKTSALVLGNFFGWKSNQNIGFNWM